MGMPTRGHPFVENLLEGTDGFGREVAQDGAANRYIHLLSSIFTFPSFLQRQGRLAADSQLFVFTSY